MNCLSKYGVQRRHNVERCRFLSFQLLHFKQYVKGNEKHFIPTVIFGYFSIRYGYRDRIPSLH
jgi:hypothetical protein